MWTIATNDEQAETFWVAVRVGSMNPKSFDHTKSGTKIASIFGIHLRCGEPHRCDFPKKKYVKKQWSVPATAAATRNPLVGTSASSLDTVGGGVTSLWRHANMQCNLIRTETTVTRFTQKPIPLSTASGYYLQLRN